MTTFIDSSGPNCATNLVVSWSATPAPQPAPPPFPPRRNRGPAPPVIAYVSPYDGSECVRQTDVGLYQNEYVTSQCPYQPPSPPQPLSSGSIAAIAIACIGSVAIAAFAAICVLQAQRTLDARKRRAKAAKALPSGTTVVRVASYRV